ncbi:hypothetical protein AUJ14_04670 [Candidatus Micrarchaeota archaeon CG1_02_55_22]|nr:MAG: hypothetical protein AUJ14_04670 [Candidatus Micrarchaeota archaeon CG1_02_55_22]
MRNLLPLIWRKIPERYNLIGSRDEETGKEYFPQRKISPAVRRRGKLVDHPMPRDGTIYSYSLVHSAPTGFEVESPYFIAIIELSNGVRILSQLVDSPAERVKMGAKVKLVFRKIFEDEAEGAIAYGYKFKVVQ